MGKLKAGTYVVAACKPDTVLSASNLGVLERSGVLYAKAEVEITDDSVSEVTLDVPDYDKEQLLSELKKFIRQVFIMNPATNLDLQAITTCE